MIYLLYIFLYVHEFLKYYKSCLLMHIWFNIFFYFLNQIYQTIQNFIKYIHKYKRITELSTNKPILTH